MLCRCRIFLLVVYLFCFPKHHIAQDQEDDYEDYYDYDSESAVDADPHIPQNVIVEAPPGGKELIVSWEAPDDEPPGYRVEYIGQPSGNEETTNVNCTISGLTPCAMYTITVISVYGDGSEYESDSERGTTESGAPGVPREVTCSAEDKSVSVTWNSPLDTNCRVDNYSVKWSYDVLWSSTNGIGGPEFVETSPFSIPNIPPYTHVNAEVAGGTGAYFGPSDMCSTTTDQGFPGKPKIDTVDTSEDSVKVSWSPPEELNGVITNYRITCINKEEGLHYFKEFGNVDKGEVTGMATCKEYEVTVAGKTSRGWGAESDPETVRLTSLVPPKKAECKSDSPRKLQVLWNHTEPDCPVTQYFIYWIGSDRHSSREWECHTVNGSDSSFEVPDVSPYTHYNVCVAVMESNVNGACCQSNTGEDAPGKVSSVGVSTKGQTFATVSWSPPASPNGIINKYKVSWMDETGKEKSKTTEDGSVFSAQTDVLTACVEYTFTVTAKTVVDWGESSDPIQDVVGNYVDESSLICSSVSSRKVKCVWTTAAPNCKIESYNYEWTRTLLWDPLTPGHSDDKEDGSLNGTETEQVYDDILPYTEFNFCISTDQNPDIKACSSTTTPQEAPGIPTKLRETHTNDSARLTWEDPVEVNGVISNWVVSWFLYGTQLGTESKGKEEHEHLIPGLTTGNNYTATVAAVTGGGTGNTAEVIIAIIGPTSPSSPNLLLIIGGSVGIVAVIAVVAACILLACRNSVKQRQKKGGKSDSDADRDSMLMPGQYIPRLSIAPTGSMNVTGLANRRVSITSQRRLSIASQPRLSIASQPRLSIASQRRASQFSLSYLAQFQPSGFSLEEEDETEFGESSGGGSPEGSRHNEGYVSSEGDFNSGDNDVFYSSHDDKNGYDSRQDDSGSISGYESRGKGNSIASFN